jgi:hypothetical protein
MDWVFMGQPRPISRDDITESIMIESNLRGRYYLWSGVAQGEKFTYESDFIPVDLPLSGPVNVQMHPIEPVPGMGDLITMILSSPDWSEEHRLMRTVTLNAYEVR